MTQGYPLAMISYGLGVLPLIREFWETHTRVTQPCYTDNAGAGGTFEHILYHFKYMQARGPLRGYFPGADQKYLGHGPEEFTEGGGVLLKYGNEDSHWLTLPWGFCRRRRCGGDLSG